MLWDIIYKSPSISFSVSLSIHFMLSVITVQSSEQMCNFFYPQVQMRFQIIDARLVMHHDFSQGTIY